MSFGVIDGVSEVVQWKIPDFLSINKDMENWIDSPPFILAGCTWKMRVYPKGNKIDGYVSAYLRKNDPNIPAKSLTFSFGIKTRNSIVEGMAMKQKFTFKEGRLSWGLAHFWDLNDLQNRKSELTPFGALTVTCRVEREARTPEEVVTSPEKLEIPILEQVEPIPSKVYSHTTMLVDLEALSSDFEDLLLSDRKYDVIMDVQGKDFLAHRTVLSARSPVFRAMYEHDTAESKSGVLTIPDCDPNSFGDFLKYLYTGRMESVSFHTAYYLYTTAEKYDVQRLRDFCADCLSMNMTSENICDVVVLADHFANDLLMASAQDFFNNNSTEILLSPEWKALLKRNIRLIDKLLSGMASAASKSS